MTHEDQSNNDSWRIFYLMEPVIPLTHSTRVGLPSIQQTCTLPDHSLDYIYINLLKIPLAAIKEQTWTRCCKLCLTVPASNTELLLLQNLPFVFLFCFWHPLWMKTIHFLLTFFHCCFPLTCLQLLMVWFRPSPLHHHPLKSKSKMLISAHLSLGLFSLWESNKQYPTFLLL